MLVSDLTDPGSFANTSANANCKTLAAAFNFGTDGRALQPREAQTI